MSLIERVQSILLRPKQTWPVIAAENTDVAAIYSRYLVILAAIPAIAGFIGWTMVGAGALGVTLRLPVATAAVQLVVGYLLSLAFVYVLALIVNALAPTFGGSKNLVAALKVVAYGSTAGFLGGIFNLLPALALLGLVAGLYSIYLIYTGLPVLMRCPQEKAGAYTAVVVVCSILAMIVLAGVTSLFISPGPMGTGANTVGGPASPGTGEMQIKTPDGATVTINPSAMAEMARKMEEASKRMEAAQQSGDGAAAGKAMGDILGAVGGGGSKGAPIPAAELKALLPDSIGGLKRASIEAQSNAAMGVAVSTAKAAYAAGDRRAELSIVDSGGLAGVATLAGWAQLTMDKETDGKVEKVYKEGARSVHEEYRKDGSHGEMTVVLANGVIVSAEGDGVDIATLKGMIQGLDLAKLETAKRPARP